MKYTYASLKLITSSKGYWIWVLVTVLDGKFYKTYGPLKGIILHITKTQDN